MHKTRRAFLVLALAVASGGSLHARADWREWLHGTPAPPPKAPPPQQLATVSAASEAARDPQVESFLRALADAIKARDGQPMVPRLSDAYAIDGLEGRAKPADLFVQAVERVPGPTEIVVESVEREANTVTARAEFRYASAEAKKRTFRFDRTGRLVWSDFFTLKVERHG
jgi:hypothetical protein